MISNNQKGFGLVEIMIALVLGLVVVLGITEIFVNARQTYSSQEASARLQEEARYALSRITQDLRMAGMFGCVSQSTIPDAPDAWDTPIDWQSSVLTVITSNPATGTVKSSNADWTVVTNCKDSASVTVGLDTPGVGSIALPIRKVSYSYAQDTQTLSVGVGDTPPAVLVSGVTDFSLSFGLAANATDTYVSGKYENTAPDPARIRSVRVSLTVSDPDGRVADQTYTAVAALRNRLL